MTPTCRPVFRHHLERLASTAMVVLFLACSPMQALRAATSEDPATIGKRLPIALVIGDSVCISGYGKYVKELLKDSVDVQIGTATTSTWTLDRIDAALKHTLGNGKAAVIHFNCGIWDSTLKSYDPDKGVFFGDLKGKRATDPVQYERNLRELVRIFKGRTDKLIWATTTPFSDDSGRHQGDDVLYNKVAEIVMRENGVMIDDLNAHMLPHLGQYQRAGDVHFSQDGYQFLARKVADCLQQALRGELKPEGFPINPDRPYTPEERERLVALTPTGESVAIVPDPDRRGKYASHESVGKSLLVHSSTGWTWKFTAYDHYTIRMQVSWPGAEFPTGDRIGLVNHPGEPSDLIVEETDTELKIRTWAMDGIPLKFFKQNMAMHWLWEQGALKESDGLARDKNVASLTFAVDPKEQFFALTNGTDLTGQAGKRIYANHDPASLPAFVSNRNYGMLLNETGPAWLELGGKRVKLGFAQGSLVDLFVLIGRDRDDVGRRCSALVADARK